MIPLSALRTFTRDVQQLRRIAADLRATAPAGQPTITLSLIREAAAIVAELCEALADELKRSHRAS